MPNNEVIMETFNTTAEVAKKADCKGLIFVGLGFAAGTAATVGLVAGAKKLKSIRAEKKAKKLTAKEVVSEK